ncbi:MAG: hypothetical protein NTV86_23625 [Planctomycetota bacterium]|nr:hypothetical protein [Planctomycetota bacterium]
MRACLLSVTVLAVGLTACRAAAQATSAPATAPADGEIARLIRELGDDRWAVREAATERLGDMGEEAAPALRQALQSEDPEVKARSQKLLDELALTGEAALVAVRARIQSAFAKAADVKAVKLARRATAPGVEARQIDWLWLGHCCQLQGDWAGAVGAYRKVVECIDADLAAGRRTPDVSAAEPGAPGGLEGGARVLDRPGPPGGGLKITRPLDASERTSLARQRTLLMLWIARIQRAELKAPAEAVKTLKEAQDYMTTGKGAFDDTWLTRRLAAEQSPAADAPVATQTWAQTEFVPANARLTWGATAIENGTATTDLAPGRETLRFSVPGDKRTIEIPFEVKPGGRYGLFVNLESPFRWRQIDLDLGGGHSETDSGLSLQRVGKEFLAVWSNLEGKLMSARSADLVRWSRPEALPFSSIFSNLAPSTFAAADGKVWLAYFSNRLSLLNRSTGGYQLWITNTPDGKAWSPPRKIDIQTVDGWPLNPPVMLADQTGVTWLFSRNYAGSVAAGETLDKLASLQPMTKSTFGEKTLNVWNFQVACEGADGFRMVFDDFGAGIYPMAFRKGLAWEAPRLLVKDASGKADNHAGQISHPCLIRGNGRAMLLYSLNEGAYLSPIDLAGAAITAGEGVKIANYVVPLAARSSIVYEGRIYLVAGETSPWLLEADLKTLLAAPTTRP